jgi:hypothetical protein
MGLVPWCPCEIGSFGRSARQAATTREDSAEHNGSSAPSPCDRFAPGPWPCMWAADLRASPGASSGGSIMLRQLAPGPPKQPQPDNDCTWSSGTAEVA